MGKKFFQILSTMKLEPLTATAVGAYSSSFCIKPEDPSTPEADYPPMLIRYGTDGAWSAYEIGTAITLNPGEKCQFWNQSEVFSWDYSRYFKFSRANNGGGRLKFSGDLLSLANWRTDLPEYIFYSLFGSFDQIVEAPEIPDVPIADDALTAAFAFCVNLNKIRVNFKSWGERSTVNWIIGVSKSGTFYKPSALPEERGDSQIPDGWTVENTD